MFTCVPHVHVRASCSRVCLMFTCVPHVHVRAYVHVRASCSRVCLMFTCVPHVHVRALFPRVSCFHSLVSTQTFRSALATSVDSCAEIKSAPSMA